MSDRNEPVVDLQLDRAHSSRIYDYFLGGKTNFLADRMAAGSVLSVFPSALVAARINREFMHRATRFLAGSGMRQFLDIGTGIPTPPNLHDIAQGIAPEARVVYTDNDPIVLAHAAALLLSTHEGRTAYVQADVNDPAGILAAPQLLDTLDLRKPVALSLNALMHFVTDDGRRRAHAIVDTLKAALPSGSTLAMSHATPDFDPEAMHKIIDIYRGAGTTLQFRSRAEFLRFFDGWELLEPGVALPHQWRPDHPGDATHVTDAEAACYAAIARKP
ncbi:SAM-dependent methyltransferase [Streptomyces sp. NPDC101227]|uniref:SAM-dependent methyltransferase n=1 Tax=Streptomyces sp. NPDC101227 TaxID=3366136 RepID=UPI0037F31260